MIYEMRKLFVLKNWLYFAGGLLVGLAILVFSPQNSNNRGVILRQSGHQFINPILSCEIGDKETFTELKPIENAIKQGIGKVLKDQNASDVSVYFRLMNSGRWTGVNEEKIYKPASLLKVLVMTGYLKAIESNPMLFEERITDSGTTYTIGELINEMIKKSSNQALNLLLDAAKPEVAHAIDGIRSDLNIPIGLELNSSQDFLSPKTYSMIFRVLYGATYLDKEMSEKAFSILSQTEFKDGLVLKLPANIMVAHKFGAASSGDVIKELHDCGIIYFPKHPYLLCVMTKGNQYEKLAQVIAEISASVYQSVEEFFKFNS